MVTSSLKWNSGIAVLDIFALAEFTYLVPNIITNSVVFILQFTQNKNKNFQKPNRLSQKCVKCHLNNVQYSVMAIN